jgi:hypothetical protein
MKKGLAKTKPFKNEITSSATGFIPGRLLLSRACFRLDPALTKLVKSQSV